jgi:serine/threonine-protein kinase
LRDLLADRLAPAAVADLESHLERCPACRTTLDRLAGGESWAAAVRDELADPADDPLDFLAPSDFPDSLGRVGPYEVKGVLGRGGNGVVLKALDPGLNRFVAVKVIAAVLAGSGAARQRFTREARAAAAVVHENVVAVHAVDQADGLPYLVMEYVKGRSAQDRLDTGGPLPVVDVLRIARQTAAGLAAAHAQGLVHRDVKPANILLENGVERVKLTDFGLARAVSDACLTQSGVIAGTPFYMAPEQARGEAVDHRADLFSLGSTLYALLAGHAPFRADTPLAVLRRVVDDAPRPLRQVNPDVPPWLEAVIAKLMAKSPADRYPTAAEAAAVFERGLAHAQNPTAGPPPRVPRPPRRWRRALAGGLMTAAGVAIVAVAARQADRPTPPEPPAPPPAETVPTWQEIEQELEAARVALSQAEPRRNPRPAAADPIRTELDALRGRAAELERDLSPSPRGAR